MDIVSDSEVKTVLHAGHLSVGVIVGAVCGLPVGGNAWKADGGVDTVVHAGHVGVGVGVVCGLPVGVNAGEADGGVDT
eukprot:1179507-Prorocentrum_minimum.AAC.1